MQTAEEQFRVLAGVIANPKPDHPRDLTSGVWITAKEMQGCPLTLERMERVAAHHPDPEPEPCEIKRRFARIRDRVRKRAEELNVSGPRPLILPAPSDPPDECA